MRSAWMILASTVAAAGCGEGEKRVTLRPAVQLPSGQSSVSGSTLSISVERLEPLAAASRYVAWGAGATTLALGELRPDVAFSVTQESLGLTAFEFTGILISEEDAGTALPTAPSTLVRLRGPLGGALIYQGATAEALNAASGSAVLEGEEGITVSTQNLPPLPAGLFYGVWVGKSGGSGGMHDHGETTGMGRMGADGMMTGNMCGMCMMNGHMDTGGGMMGPGKMSEVHEVLMTIESERGVDARAACGVMHGEVPTEDMGDMDM